MCKAKQHRFADRKKKTKRADVPRSRQIFHVESKEHLSDV